MKSHCRNTSIINIASTAGKTGIGSNIAYCASKAGIITMTKSLARSLGPKIRVNSVAPGLVETKMTKSWKNYHKNTIKKSPMKKETTPDDIANVVISLADKMHLINGECLIVDSGTHLNN